MDDTIDKHAPRMDLDISADGLHATLVLQGRPDPSIHEDAVIALLNQHKVVYGVNKAAIQQVLDAHRTDTTMEAAHTAVVAKGVPPTKGKDGRLEMLVEESDQVAFDEGGRADFRNVSKFQTVDKDQLLARIHPPEEGVPGIDVFGQEVKPPEPFTPKLEAGQNVSEVPGSGEFLARIHGIFIKGEDRLDVSPVLQVPRNVGLESGNINYDGNVQVGGNVERGSMVAALGDLTVGGLVESGEVRTGGSLNVRKGINTRQEGLVKVGGNLKAGYVENSRIDVEGDVIVDRSIIQSRLICYGNMHLTLPGSTITGGEVIIFGNLTSGVLGNKTETPTTVWIGAHFKNMEYYKISLKELEKVERDFHRKTELVEKIKVYVQRARGNIPVDKKAAFRVQFKEYKEAAELRARVQGQIKEFASGRWNKEEVRLVVRETMHPGVEIHYHGNVKKIRAPQTRVVLRFVPGVAEPIMEAWKPE